MISRSWGGSSTRHLSIYNRPSKGRVSLAFCCIPVEPLHDSGPPEARIPTRLGHDSLSSRHCFCVVCRAPTALVPLGSILVPFLFFILLLLLLLLRLLLLPFALFGLGSDLDFRVSSPFPLPDCASAFSTSTFFYLFYLGLGLGLGFYCYCYFGFFCFDFSLYGFCVLLPLRLPLTSASYAVFAARAVRRTGLAPPGGCPCSVDKWCKRHATG